MKTKFSFFARVASLLLIAMVVPQIIHAANQSQKNLKKQVYFELFGPGLIYSINFETKVNERIAVRAGAEILPHGDHVDFLIPLTVSGISGKDRLKFEYGGGVLLGTLIGALTDSNRLFAITFLSGLRWEFQKTVLRLIIAPIWIPRGSAADDDNGFLITIGFSAGVKF